MKSLSSLLNVNFVGVSEYNDYVLFWLQIYQTWPESECRAFPTARVLRSTS